MTMRYITQVRVKNFQSHEDTTIDLHPGLNALTGPSDNGKSAILRAIRWATWNQAPDGDWVRQGANNASVELVISDGTHITRERRGKRNFYTIERPGGEPLQLADFGLPVPLEVLEAHGMLPVKFDADHPSLLNLATQLESPFFITDTAPLRARVLSRLAGVHVADHAITMANGDLQAIGRETKTREDELARLEQQLERYAGVDQEEERLTKAEATLNWLGAMAENHAQLTTLRQRQTGLNAEIAGTTARLEGLRRAVAATDCVARAETAHARKEHLWELSDELPVITDAIHMCEHTIRWANGVAGAAPQIEDALTATTRLRTLQSLQAARDGLRVEWADTRVVLKRTAGAPDAAVRIETATGACSSLHRLRALKESWQRIDVSLAEVRTTLDRTAAREQAREPLSRATTAEERYTRLTTLQASIKDVDTRLARGQAFIAEVTARRETTAAEYAQALQEAGCCPTCLQPVDQSAAAGIAADLAHTHA